MAVTFGEMRGEGKCLQAPEDLKLSLKWLALSNDDPGGIAIPSNQLLVEPRQLRSNDSSMGDLYVVTGELYAKHVAMDLMFTSILSKSALLHTSQSFDRTLRLIENKKLTKDLRNTDPSTPTKPTQRFILMVQNQQCGKRGYHFEVTH
jgi:hypothetical protein